MSYFPTPNRAGTATNANNYIGASRNALHRDIVVGRLDHQFRPADLVTARYYINDAGTNNSGTYGIPVADTLADITDVRVQTILGSHTHIFRPNLTNDLRYTYLRRKFLDSRPGLGEDLAAKIGLKGVTGAALGNPTMVYRFQTPIIDQQFIEGLSWTRGRHALKFGAEYRWAANDEIRDRGSAGNFTISPLITDLPGSSHSWLTTRFRSFWTTSKRPRNSAPPAATWTHTIAAWTKDSAEAMCPNAWLVTMLYEVPKFKSNRMVNAALGGWKVGLLETAESGPTLSVITSANATNAFPAGSLRPNLLRDSGLPSGQRTVGCWFDTSAYANPAPLMFGNSPRSGLRGAPVITTDATLEKTFVLTERWKIDLRVEFYNLLNHPIFNVPGFTFGAADFGAVSSARSPRTAQLAARLSF